MLVFYCAFLSLLSFNECHVIILKEWLMNISGYQCPNKDDFQCENGFCIKERMRCDGDFNCKDKSDEKKCKCVSTKFLCSSGECITSMMLCNGKGNCKDGSDENNCSMYYLWMYTNFYYCCCCCCCCRCSRCCCCCCCCCSCYYTPIFPCHRLLPLTLLHSPVP